MTQEKWVRPDCEDPDAGLRPNTVQDSLYSHILKAHDVLCVMPSLGVGNRLWRL